MGLMCLAGEEDGFGRQKVGNNARASEAGDQLWTGIKGCSNKDNDERADL